MAGYVRQSTADIIPTATVRAAPINAEYNALRDAFAASGGHKHDGTSGEGEYVPLIADLDALNKVVIDTTNNRVGVFVEVSAAAVEQIRIQDGVIVPVTDNDIDLGTSSLEFKDLYLDGTAYIDTLAVHESATITSNFSVNGNTTLGNAASDTVTFTADIASAMLPSADNTHDLGAVGSEWRNLYIDGTANIDALIADTATISAGTIDNTVIGGSTAVAGSFTTISSSGATTLASLTVSGATALNGGLTLDTNKFTVADTTGNTAIAGTLDVTGATTVADFTATGTTVLPATSFGDNNITNVGNIALDSITADGSSITITGNTTFADGAYDFDVASHDGSNGLKLAGTLVTSSAAELNKLDGATVTTTEINILDGDNSATSTTVADADRVVMNDNGTMVQVAVTDLAAYFDDEITAMPNLVTTAATTVGALNSGSITSGFGSIDTGSSTITTTGNITGGNIIISDGGNIGSASDTDAIAIASNGNVTLSQNLTVSGDLQVDGTTTTVNSNNLSVDDQLIELGNGRTGSATGDSGIVIERGSDANAFIGFDESADKFTVGTGTFTGTSTGDLSITTGTLVANIEGNVTGDLTGNADTATSLETARTIAGQSFDGTANISIATTDLTSVTATAAEVNIMDGDTAASSTTLADADRVVVNDAGTMKQVALTDFETYFESALDTLSNVTTVGTLNSGSITSGFGSIDNGSSAITTTGTITFGTLSDGSDSVTDIVTSVGSGSANSELPTALAVENRIQAINSISNNVSGLNATGAELNAVADVSAITIDTSTAIANNDGIAVFDSSASAIGYFDVDLLDTYFAGTTKTLTNKTLTSPTVSGLYLSDAGFIVEGSSADGNESTVTFTNPTADRTITFPDATGTVALSGATQNVDFGTVTADGLTVDGDTNGDPSLAHFYNINTGTAAEATAYITNSAAKADGLFLQQLGSSFTTAGGFVQDGSTIGSGTGASGGLSIMTRAAADMRFYTNGHTNEAMRIDTSQRVLLGHTSSIAVEGNEQKLQLVGSDANDGITIARFNNNFGPYLSFGRSGSGTIGSYTAVPVDDELGRIQWGVADGTDMTSIGASISAFTEQLAASNDVPSRLVFSTTADGASSPTERMRISQNGYVGIGTSGDPLRRLTVKSTDGTNQVGRFESTESAAWVQFASGSTGTASRIGSPDNTTNASVAFVTADVERMRVNPDGHVLIGHTSGILHQGEHHELQVSDTNFSLASFATYRNGSDGAMLALSHSRNGTKGSQTILNADDNMGGITFFGSDGTDFARGAQIRALVDGTPGNNDMPGRIIFATSSDGTDSPTERMRIDSDGLLTAYYNILIDNNADSTLFLGKGKEGVDGVVKIKTVQTGGDSDQLGISFYTHPNSSGSSLSEEAGRFTAPGQFIVGGGYTYVQNWYGQSGINDRQINAYGVGENGAITAVSASASTVQTGQLNLGKMGTSNIESYGILDANEAIGRVSFQGADGTYLQEAAYINVDVDGTPGAADMPGRMEFYTTADGTNTPTERMRISQGGQVSIGVSDTPASTSALQVYSGAAGRSVFRHASGDGGVVLAGSASGSGASLIFGNTWDNATGSNFVEEYRLFHNGSNDSLEFNYNANASKAMVLTSSGNVLVGSLGAAETTISGGTPNFQVTGSVFGSYGSFTRRQGSTQYGSGIILAKSRNASANSYTIVQDNDILGSVIFIGDDGTDLDTYGATIAAEVDGTPGANDMPGRLVFKTTADGANSPSERMRITNDGGVIFQGPANAGSAVIASGTLGSVNTFAELAGSGGSGTMVLSRATTSNDAEIGNLRYVNRTNSSDSGLGSTGRLIAGISVRSVTSDSNAGGDSGSTMKFFTKPEAGSYAERLTIASGGNVTVQTGNLIIGTSGQGIDFSASEGSGASSSLLDDYEEGTWTPVITPEGGSAAGITVNHATYTKVGRLVSLVFDVTINSISGTSSSNAIELTGMPFNSATSHGGGPNIAYGNLTASMTGTLALQGNTTSKYRIVNLDGATALNASDHLQATSRLEAQFTYHTT